MFNNVYQLNTLNNILAYDDDLIFIENPLESFIIKGNDVNKLFTKILEQFKKPLNKYNVISSLKDKYELNTLNEAIDLLINKRVIIPINSDILAYSYSKEFLNKNTFDIELARKHGVELKESQKIAILGNQYLVLSILKNYLEQNNSLSFIIISEFTEESIKEIENLNIIYDNINIEVQSKDIGMIEELIVHFKEVDFVIVAVSKRKKHKLIEIHKLMIELNKNWVRLFLNEDTVEIGPLFIHGVSSCYKCLIDKFNTNLDTIEDVIYFNQILPKFEYKPSHISLPMARIGISILLLELNKYETTNRCDLINKIYFVNIFNLEISKVDIIRNLYCESCKDI